MNYGVQQYAFDRDRKGLEPKDSGPWCMVGEARQHEEKMRARSFDAGYQMGVIDAIHILNLSTHEECQDEDNPQCDWCCMIPDVIELIRPLLKTVE